MGLIYHIAYAADWEEARRAGEYRISTRGRTLEQEGFIHSSRLTQVAPVANAFYHGERDLLLLVIDEDRVGPDIRYEPVPGSNEEFPHIYGPLNTDAVIETLPLDPSADGDFTVTPGTPVGS